MPEKQMRFWMVWNPEGRQPQYKHFTRTEADMEAQRLARVNPEQSFYVLKAVSGFKSQPSPVDQIKMFTDPDAIPF